MYHTVYVTSFFDMDGAPDPVRYSRMKFGSDVAAREIGHEMAAALFEKHSDKLLANDVVIIPSPYNYVKNAATVVTEHMIDKLNDLLVNASGQHVDFSTIHRKVSYIADYGFLPKAKREKLLSNDRFYMNKQFLAGKLLVFVDDIKITGTHEDKLKEILKVEGMDNEAIFVYSALYQGNSPEIEAALNFSAVSSIEDYRDLTDEPNHHLLVRPIKYILKQDPLAFQWFLDHTDTSKLWKLYYACLGEGYTMIPDYQINIHTLREFLK